jgi:hypothetical protein
MDYRSVEAHLNVTYYQWRVFFQEIIHYCGQEYSLTDQMKQQI